MNYDTGYDFVTDMLIYGFWMFTIAAQDAWEVSLCRYPLEPLGESINWHAHGLSNAGLTDADMDMSTMVIDVLTYYLLLGCNLLEST